MLAARFTSVLTTLALLGLPAALASPSAASSARSAAAAGTPTVVLTAPIDNRAIWEDLVLAAEATPGDGGAAIARVEFYLDAVDPRATYEPFHSDDTAPYGLTVPIADLGWDPLESHKVTAVAVAADGRASSHPADAGGIGTTWTVVGPPPVVAWSPAPPATDTVAGSTSDGVKVDFSASLDEAVPDDSDSRYPSRIHRIEHLLDGEVVHDYRPEDDPRTLAASAYFLPSAALTGGVHTVGIRVTAAYRGFYTTVGEVEADVLVSDGTRLAGPVMAGTRRVRDGFVVTAGDVVRFRAPIEVRVPGSYLDRAFLTIDDDVSVDWPLGYREFPCDGTSGCTAGATIRSWDNPWYVPEVPGRATLTLTSAVVGETRGATTVRRTIVVQPAARLAARVSTQRIRVGEAVRMRGRLTRLDNGAPQAGRTVRVQWRPAGTSRWRTVATRTTDRYGRVAARLRPARSGDFRLVSPEVRGTLGRGVSVPRWVAVRR